MWWFRNPAFRDGDNEATLQETFRIYVPWIVLLHLGVLILERNNFLILYVYHQDENICVLRAVYPICFSHIVGLSLKTPALQTITQLHRKIGLPRQRVQKGQGGCYR